MKKNKILFVEYPNYFWGKGEVFKNGKKIANINKFYRVTEDWIFIYGTVGGSGTEFKQGDLEEKIYIGDCEFKKIEKIHE